MMSWGQRIGLKNMGGVGLTEGVMLCPALLCVKAVGLEEARSTGCMWTVKCHGLSHKTPHLKAAQRLVTLRKKKKEDMGEWGLLKVKGLCPALYCYFV